MSAMEIIPLNESDIEAAADVLSKAFQNDSLSKYMIPDPEERAHKLSDHFMPILRYGLLFGEVLTTNALNGIAVWLPPGLWDVIPERAVRAGFDQLPTLIGEEAVNRFDRAIEYISMVHARDVPGDHWYLMAVGIDPAKQGCGIGRALIEPIQTRAVEANIPCYLETGASVNIAFYKKLGFQELISAIEPRSQLPFWTFLYPVYT